MESNDGLLEEVGGGRRSSPVKGGRGRAEESKDGGDGRGKGGKSPIETFVDMEWEMGLDLVSTVNLALTTLRKILYGSGLLTPESLKIGGDLLKGVVPRSWEKLYEGDPKPTAYITSIVNKTVALKRWKKEAKRGGLLNECLNLSDLFRAGTFLEALR